MEYCDAPVDKQWGDIQLCETETTKDPHTPFDYSATSSSSLLFNKREERFVL